MIIKPITYTDYNGTERTENHCFHLSKMDRAKLDAKYNLSKFADGTAIDVDASTMIQILDEVIIMAHGVRSDDGKRLIRVDDFKDSAAYEALMDELLFGADTDEKVNSFLKSIIGDNV